MENKRERETSRMIIKKNKNKEEKRSKVVVNEEEENIQKIDKEASEHNSMSSTNFSFCCCYCYTPNLTSYIYSTAHNNTQQRKGKCEILSAFSCSISINIFIYLYFMKPSARFFHSLYSSFFAFTISYFHRQMHMYLMCHAYGNTRVYVKEMRCLLV